MSNNIELTYVNGEVFHLSNVNEPNDVRIDVDEIVRFSGVRKDHLLKVLRKYHPYWIVDYTDVVTTEKKGRPVKKLYVTEPGLYFCMLQGYTPKALEFQKWVCEVVLPAIKENYAEQTRIDSRTFAAAEKLFSKKIEALEASIASPMNFYNHLIAGRGGGMDMKSLRNGILFHLKNNADVDNRLKYLALCGMRDFSDFLVGAGFIYLYNESGIYKPTKESTNKGYCALNELGTGEPRAVYTDLGFNAIMEKLLTLDVKEVRELVKRGKFDKDHVFSPRRCRY